MSLKLIGAGFGRTGTSSTYTALNQLGLPCYHMLEVLENKANKTHIDFWCNVANGAAGAQHDWKQVFANYQAAIDHPAASVWRELMHVYPDAKVLLTVHPVGAEAWYQSVMETIYVSELSWQFKFLSGIVPLARKHREMTHKLVWQRAHRGIMQDRAAAIAQYHQHIEDVKALVPPDRLLVFSVKEGWKPLCDFVGVPLPTTEFPNINDRAEFKRRLAKVNLAAYTLIGLGGLTLSTSIYGVLRLIG